MTSATSTAPVSSDKSTTVRFNPLQATVRPLLRGLSQVAPGAATRVAGRLFLTPPRFRPPVRELWWATDAEAWELPFGRGKLAAWRWGWGGDTVLLVHGWAGRGLQLGAFAAPLVEAGYQVVTYDAPGHGRSTGARSSLPEKADAVAAMVHHLGGVAAIVAHSAGAAATTVALGRAGTRLPAERLVYLAPTIDLTGVAARFGDLTGFTPRVVERMRHGIERRFGVRWSELQGLRIAPRMDRPLLVVHDRDDREVPCAEGEALTAAWPGARLLTTSGRGHQRLLRDPDVVTAAVGFVTAAP